MLFIVSFFIDIIEYEINEILDTEFIIDILISGRELIRFQKEPDGNGFVFDGRAVHDFEFAHDGVVFI